MKVKVEFTVDVDADAWSHEYGTNPAEVREDVKQHAKDMVFGQFDSIGVLGRWSN